MKFTFNVGTKIKEAWPLYKENFGIMILLVIVSFAAQGLGQNNHKENIFLQILLMIVSILLSYIWAKSLLDLTQGKSFNPFSKESLPSFLQFWDFVKTSILFTLCLFGGALLLIVPAFYVAGRLFPAVYLSVEKSQGARKNLKEAWEMTRGNGWRILWKSIVIGLFILVGFLAFVVGSIVTYPVGLMVSVMMYRELVKFNSNLNTINPLEISVLKEEGKIEEKITAESDISSPENK